MDEQKLLGLLGQGGLGAVLIAIIWVIGNRFIAAMDKLVDKIDAHHTKDTEHHAEVEQGLAKLQTRIDVIVERGDRDRISTPALGIARQSGQ